MIFGFGDAVGRAREKAARSARGPLAEYYAVPVPGAGTPADDLALLAIDLETTGLDTASDRVLSVGFVAVDGPGIDLGSARNLLVAGSEVGQSATIHGLTDDAVASGVPVGDAVEATLAALAGRVLLAHHAALELGFLSRLCQALYGAPFVCPAVDTLLLQARIVAPGFHDEPRPDDLRLWTARARFGLPKYAAHKALTDALACAELYLAQLTALPGTSTLKTLSS